MSVRNLAKVVLFISCVGCAWLLFFGLNYDLSSIQTIALKAKQENNEIKRLMGAQQASLANTQEALKHQEKSSASLQGQFDDYKTSFSLVEFHWMRDEVKTCYAGLKDGQTSIVAGRWAAAWDARAQIWRVMDETK